MCTRCVVVVLVVVVAVFVVIFVVVVVAVAVAVVVVIANKCKKNTVTTRFTRWARRYRCRKKQRFACGLTTTHS